MERCVCPQSHKVQDEAARAPPCTPCAPPRSAAAPLAGEGKCHPWPPSSGFRSRPLGAAISGPSSSTWPVSASLGNKAASGQSPSASLTPNPHPRSSIFHCLQVGARLPLDWPGEQIPGSGDQHSDSRDCPPAPLQVRGKARLREGAELGG